MKQAETEARRWWSQARDDRRFAEWVLSEDRFFDKGCFIAQQSGEKALKACLYGAGRRNVLGHSLAELVRDLRELHPAADTATDPAKRLDRYYIPTRYPTGLPGGTPHESYSRADLEAALADLRAVHSMCEGYLGSLGIPSGSPGKA